jgi:hypothetical protein
MRSNIERKNLKGDGHKGKIIALEIINEKVSKLVFS